MDLIFRYSALLIKIREAICTRHKYNKIFTNKTEIKKLEKQFKEYIKIIDKIKYIKNTDRIIIDDMQQMSKNLNQLELILSYYNKIIIDNLIEY